MGIDAAYSLRFRDTALSHRVWFVGRYPKCSCHTAGRNSLGIPFHESFRSSGTSTFSAPKMLENFSNRHGRWCDTDDEERNEGKSATVLAWSTLVVLGTVDDDDDDDADEDDDEDENDDDEDDDGKDDDGGAAGAAGRGVITEIGGGSAFAGAPPMPTKCRSRSNNEAMAAILSLTVFSIRAFLAFLKSRFFEFPKPRPGT